jgi:hypothetical protein
VLTEVPNRPSGHRFIALAAARSGCQVTEGGDEGLLIRCAEGLIHVPTFPGPPTLAARCLDGTLEEPETCRSRIRRLLQAADTP